MKRKWVFSILPALLFLSMIACQGVRITCKNNADFSGASGGSIAIAWDPNTDPNLGGYRVYYGPSPGKYKNCVDVGKLTESTPNVIRYTLTSLVKGRRYYIAVTAYPTYETPFHKSGFSNEVNALGE